MRNISFRPDENKGPVIVLIGRRDTGKSYLVRDLLYYHQDIPIGTVISGTEAGNGFYSEHVPKLFIHDEYNSAIIENILKRQKQVLKQMKKEIDTYKRSTIDPRAFVILDDCLYDASWTRDKMMRLLFMNGRHWKIMLIITMQYPLGIPPNLRTNIDYVFILREPYIKNRRIIHENYAGTASGKKALFYMAECYYRLGDFDKATEYYTQFIDKSRKGDYLISFAYEGLGYCYEGKGGFEKALDYYKKSMEQKTLDIRKMEYINIARCYEALNDKTKALEYYKKLENEQSDSLIAELVQDKVNTLTSD